MNPYTDQELKHLYLEEYLSIGKIATLCGLGRSYVREHLKKIGVIMRPIHVFKECPSIPLLYDLYITRKQSASQIAIQFSTCKRTVLRWLREVNISVRECPAAKIGHNHKLDVPLSKSQLEKMYLQDYRSLRSIAEEFGVTRPVISRLRREYEIPTRAHKTRKYTFNESFFSTWSASMAYVLGYICADGCLTNDDCTVTIASNDIEHLLSISRILSLNYPHVCGRGKTKSLVLRSKKLYFDLVNLGLTQRKSLTLRFPSIPHEYMTDFIRGDFDGDGCISITQKTGAPSVSFASGSLSFITVLHEVLVNLGLSTRSIRLKKSNQSTHGAYVFSYQARRDILLFRELIYGNEPELFLPRKRKRFDQLALRWQV